MEETKETSLVTHREVHKLFWIVKGYITTDEIAYQCYNGYVKRTWYNEETYIYEEGFEEAYNAKFK